jgi:hypothetical protein
MNKWIEYSLKYRQSQKGFAIPVAVGMGLIILLVGITMLLRSQSSQVSAIAQKDTAKSLNAAEAGVSDIRALINQHRAIANHPACIGRDGSGNCLDSGSTVSWRLPDNIPNILATCGVDETDEIASLAQRTWQPVDPNDSNQGQYRLLDYAPAEGKLRVQGRMNPGEPSESVAELEVRFPVNPVEDQTAGLWVTTSADTEEINADVLGDCDSTLNTQHPAGSSYQARQLGLTMPSIPAQPPGAMVLSASTFIEKSLPRPGDSPNGSNGQYQYVIDTLGGPTLTTLTIAADKQVEIWVDGNIDLRGKIIKHTCGDVPGCGPFQVKFYPQGNSGDDIALDQGTVICDIFIHAPTYDVTNYASGTTTEGCGNGTKRTSVFWVKSWDDEAGVSTPVLDPPRAIWKDAPLVYPPRLGPLETWQTQERSVS